MPEINENQLKLQIKDKNFSPVYFLYGEETYLISHYAGKIIDAVISGTVADLNLNSFEGKNTSVSEIIGAAFMLPVMCEKRCVSVNDFNINKLSASDLNDLVEYLLKPCPETVLVFWFSKSTAGDDEKIKKIINAAKTGGTTVNFKHYEVNDLAKMLCLTSAKKSSRMQTSTARYFIDCCGNDISTLLNELDKLCAYRTGQEIMPEDIDLLTAKSLSATSFNIVRAIRKGQADEAFSLLDTLYTQKLKPTMILGALSSSYINMYRMKTASQEGIKISEMSAMLGAKKSSSLEYASKDAASYSRQCLKRCIEILLETDTILKQSPIDDRIVLERAITRLLCENERKNS